MAEIASQKERFEGLLGQACEFRGQGATSSFNVEAFFENLDGQLLGDQQPRVAESDNRDYEAYLKRAVKVGVIAEAQAKEVARMLPSDMALNISGLMPFVLIEERNVGILENAFENGVITDKQLTAILQTSRENRTAACNRLHTVLRVKDGDSLDKSRQTAVVAIAEISRGVVQGVHPLASGHGGVSF